MKFSKKSLSGVWVIVLSLGIALGGYFIGNGIYRAMSGRTVTVKGLAERDVVADTAVWNIKINGVGGDLTVLQQEIDNDLSEIHKFLTDSGFAPSDIHAFPAPQSVLLPEPECGLQNVWWKAGGR